ncbi:MAG: hypothetical protein ACHREM_17625, partial [Polyangiales bacterium]
HVQQMFVSADGTRVGVVVAPTTATPDWTSRPAQVLVGDGASWTVIYSGMDAGVSLTSNDLSLFEVTSDCPGSGSPESLISVVDASGHHVFDEQSCAPGAMSFVEGFAPGGGYFVVAVPGPEGGAGTPTIFDVKSGTQTPLAVDAIGELFATSIVAWKDGANHYFDTTGLLLNLSALPCDVTQSDLCASGGALYTIADRALDRVGAVPSGVDPANVAGLVVGGYVRTVPGNPAARSAVVDADNHAVASFIPGPAPSPDFAVASGAVPSSIEVQAVAASSPTVPRWFVMTTLYNAASEGDPSESPPYALSDDLWVLADTAGNFAPKVIPIRKGRNDQFTDAFSRDYVPSATGRYVLFVDSANALHAIDVDSGSDRILTSDYSFLAANTLRLTGVGGTNY